MIISIFTDKNSWLYSDLKMLKKNIEDLGFNCTIYNKIVDGINGDIAFFLSYFEIVKPINLKQHKNNIVVHASDLPIGKGWSPMTWQILEGKNEIPISLLEASPKVDSGDIYFKEKIIFEGHELISELRDELSKKTYSMCLKFIKNYPKILEKGYKQSGVETFYKKRGPDDSALDVNKTIIEQFNLLRTVDNENYPAFFIHKGKKFLVKIEKTDDCN